MNNRFQATLEASPNEGDLTVLKVQIQEIGRFVTKSMGQVTTLGEKLADLETALQDVGAQLRTPLVQAEQCLAERVSSAKTEVDQSCQALTKLLDELGTRNSEPLANDLDVLNGVETGNRRTLARPR